MDPPMDHSENIAHAELSRQKLEQSMEQLRSSLQYWRATELEYEELKEEIETLSPNGTRKDMLEIGSALDGNMIDEKEINNLVGHHSQSQRSPKQVVGLISRRIEYVQRNIESVSNQLARSQGESSNDSVPRSHECSKEGGLPLTEIHEDLDEEGNVISGHVSQPGNASSKILHSLDKAGVRQSDGAQLENGVAEDDQKDSGNGNDANAISHAQDVVNAGSESSIGRKKSVAFATGTKEVSIEEKAASTAPLQSPQAAMSAQMRIAELARGSFSDSDRVLEVGDDDRPIAVKGPQIAKEDSPEDASLRREMLNYTMNEIGSVVAEIDLEEGENDGSESDDLEDFSETSSDMEDERGMSRAHGMNDQYRQEMSELEAKLNSRMLQNVGPKPEEGVKEENWIEDTGKLLTSQDTGAPQDTRPKTKSKEKGVRFAEHVDIAPTKSTNNAQSPKSFETSNGTDSAIQDNIAEHTITSPSYTSSGQADRKVSRFKQARSAKSPTSNTDKGSSSQAKESAAMQSAPLADRIMER
ncbi:MAG: hypothetical protein M1831_004055 [Alyxoria varia]|nr:MAG: hypothetical protein M1831_004055 [Alyxoria varia]